MPSSVVLTAVVLGCPVHRVQAPELGPDELVAVGRDAECFALAHDSQWHCERRALLNGHRRRLPLTYANPATPNLVPDHFDSLGRPGGPGRGSQPAGGSPQPP